MGNKPRVKKNVSLNNNNNMNVKRVSVTNGSRVAFKKARIDYIEYTYLVRYILYECLYAICTNRFI